MLPDILFILTFFSLFALIGATVKGANISLTTLSIPSVTISAFCILAFIGYFPLYFGLDPYRVEDGVVIKEVVFKAFFFSALSILGFVVGMSLSKITFKGGLEPKYNLPILPPSRLELLLLFALMVLCVTIIILYCQKVPRIALWVAITEGFTEAKIARSDMGNGFDGKYHWYSIAMHDLSALATYSIFCAWLCKKRLGSFLLLLGSLGITGFAMIMHTEKGPIVWFILGLFFTFIIVRWAGALRLKHLVAFGVVGGTVLLVSDILFMGTSGVAGAIGSIASRAITGGITPSYFYLEFFPAHQEFLLGKSFPNPGGILPYDPYPLTVEVMNWIHPYHIGSGIIGTAPTVFWGEIYANFGVPGIILLPLPFGFFIGVLIFLINKLPLRPTTVGLIVWLMLHYKDLAMTGISGFMIDLRLIVILLVSAILQVALSPRRRRGVQKMIEGRSMSAPRT